MYKPLYGSDSTEDIKEDLAQDIIKCNSNILKVDMELYFNKLSKLIYKTVKETPYGSDTLKIYRLYMSCLISLLKGFTLSNEDKFKISAEAYTKPKNIDEDILSVMYNNANLNSPTAFHLNKDMEDLIFVLVNKIRKQISNDIKDMIRSYEPTEDIIEAILMAPISELNENEGDD